MLSVKNIKFLPTKAKYARIYVWPEGENIAHNLLARHNRPYNVYKAEVLPQLTKALGIEGDLTYKWSQKAGCSCGCSPGFIEQSGKLRYDIHVDVVEVIINRPVDLAN